MPVIKATAPFAHFTSQKKKVQQNAGRNSNSCICCKNSRSLTHTSMFQVYLKKKKRTATSFCLADTFFSSITVNCYDQNRVLEQWCGGKKTNQSRVGGHGLGEGSSPQGNREQSDTHRAIRTSICRLGQTGLRLHNFRIRQTSLYLS